MLAFVTSLRHPDNSTDYRRVEALLERTLRSIDGQRDRRFGVVVVGNVRPPFSLPDHAEFVPVDFPAPSPVRSARTDREAVLADKGTKLAIGMVAARRSGASHAMVVDADDYVSRRIAGYVNQHPEAPGWYVDDGYVLSAEHGVIHPVTRFNERCGTSLIMRTDLLGIPDLPLTASQDELREGFGAFTVRELLGSHRTAVAHFAQQGTPLVPLPFPGAVYVVGTGENFWAGGLDRFAHPVGPLLASEFGMAPTFMRPDALAWFAPRLAGTAVRRLRRAVLSS